ncbi:hypothetical protein Tco_0442670 [Tanacetum coccineum]
MLSSWVKQRSLGVMSLKGFDESRFQIGSMGELTFILGLQVKQKPDGIFISHDKYIAEILKKFDFASVKTASTPIEISSISQICACSRRASFDLESYSDSDYAGEILTEIHNGATISLIDDHSLLSKMAALESCPKHNMIAYLEKTEGNVEFHEVIDFLQRSYIFHALTVSPVISTTFVEQFWTSANEGRTRDLMDEDKELDEERLSTEDGVSTDKEKVSTDFEKKVSTENSIENRTEDEVLKFDPKDKGKKKIEEEDETESEDDDIPQVVKKFKQLESDEVLARKVQEEWEAEEERNRLAEEEATNEALIKNFDEIKARIEADRILAEKLQEQEREQFTIEERAKFLHDTIAAQRKFLAKQRSEAIRNRPPTKNQLRNQMMTYLKHVGNFKHSESDEDVHVRVGSCCKYDKPDPKMNKKDSSKEEEIKQESKVEVKEEDEGEKNTRKRKHALGDQYELLVTRKHGQQRYFSTLMRVLSVFDREDLDAVYKLVMDIYQDKIPKGWCSQFHRGTTLMTEKG